MVAFIPLVIILLALGILGVVHFLLLLETASQIQFYRRNADALSDEFTAGLFEVIFIPLFSYVLLAMTLTVAIHYLCIRSKATSFLEYHRETLDGLLDNEVESLFLQNPILFNSMLSDVGFNKAGDRASIIFEFQQAAAERNLKRIQTRKNSGLDPFNRWKEKLDLALLTRESLILAMKNKNNVLQILKDAAIEPVGERLAIQQSLRNQTRKVSLTVD